MDYLGRMGEPTQETPQGETIPVPTRKQVLDDLLKVAKPPATEPEPSDGDAGEGSAEQQ